MTIYYHAGPAGLTSLTTLRDLIDDGTVTVDEACEAWRRKWHDSIEPEQLLAHPTMDEVSLTTDVSLAREIADSIGGSVYLVDIHDDEILRHNEEGFPVCGPTSRITEI